VPRDVQDKTRPPAGLGVGGWLVGFHHGAATEIDRHAIMCVASGPHQGRRLSCQTAHVPETWAVDLFSRWLAA